MTLALAPRAGAPTQAPVELRGEQPGDRVRVDRLVDQAFGPGRFAKTAERLREGNRLRLDLSVCAWAGNELVGAVRQWPIRVGADDAIFLGPIAVREDQRSHGLGATLISRACEVATAAGERLVLLVGPASFFEPLGFVPVPLGQVQMPGPVDPRRILWRPLREDGLEGVAGPARVPAPWLDTAPQLRHRGPLPWLRPL